jgi:thioredoxin-related protein
MGGFSYGEDPSFKIYNPSFKIFKNKNANGYTKEIIEQSKKDNKPLLVFVDCEARDVNGFLTCQTTIEKIKETNKGIDFKKNQILISYFTNGGKNHNYINIDYTKDDSVIKSIYQEISGRKLVVVSTTWCIPCQKLKQEVLPTLRKYINVVEVDGDFDKIYGANSFPTIIYFNEGKEIWRKYGYMSASAILNDL